MEPSRVATVLRSPATAAVLGGLSGLVPVGRARGVWKLVLVGGPAALVAGAVAVGQHRDEDGASARSGLSAAAFPAAAGVLTAGVEWGALVLDREAEAFLRRRGAPSPRLVLAAVSAVLTVLVVRLDPPSGSAPEAPGEAAPRASAEEEGPELP